MSSKSIGWACAAILLGSTVVNAQVDLGKMLGSLSFAGEDPPSVTEQDAVSEQAPIAEAPVAEAPDQVSPQSVLDEGPIGGSGLDDYWQADAAAQNQAGPLREIPTLPRLPDSAPSQPPHANVSQSGVPVPSVVGSRVDLDALVGQSEPAFDSAANAATECESMPHAAMRPRDPWVHGHPGYPSGGPVHVAKVPRPTPCLEFPNLPPPASPEAYYRTPACYRDLWSGYGDQAAKHCQKWHRHLHGHCQCLNPGHGQCSGAPIPCGCASCQHPVAAAGEVPCAVAPTTTRQR